MKEHNMASSPAAMLKTTTEWVQKLTGDDMRKLQDEELISNTLDMNLKAGKMPVLMSDDMAPFQKVLNVKEVNEYTKRLTECSLQSKEDGELLWGRIQGTKYEKMGRDYIESELKKMNLDQVCREDFPSRCPLWRPAQNDLIITQAPGFSEGYTYKFENALTPFHSACTPKEGVEKEIVYVGEGTAAELKGRDLTDKIVLLRATTAPGGAMYGTCRVAFSRLATGDYGMPAGVVIWWDVPGAKQVAGRVGAPGGGDQIGLALPWITINNDDGYYLRFLIDQSMDSCVKVYMNVQGDIEGQEDRMTGNVYGVLDGVEDKYILICTHVDCYFYGIYDNGSSIAISMALAKYYASLPKEQRRYGFIFLYEGGHEIPGCGGTLEFIQNHKKLIQENLLLVLRIEHTGSTLYQQEGPIILDTNEETPMMPLITNQSPLLKKIMLDATYYYQIPVGCRYLKDPVADELAFYPPYNDDLGEVISIGWIATAQFYHSTADGDNKEFINDRSTERMLWAYAYVIERIFEHTPEEFHKDEIKRDDHNIYASKFFSMYLGKF